MQFVSESGWGAGLTDRPADPRGGPLSPESRDPSRVPASPTDSDMNMPRAPSRRPFGALPSQIHALSVHQEPPRTAPEQTATMAEKKGHHHRCGAQPHLAVPSFASLRSTARVKGPHTVHRMGDITQMAVKKTCLSRGRPQPPMTPRGRETASVASQGTAALVTSGVQ